MSLALKQLRKERKESRNRTLREIAFSCLWLVPVFVMAMLAYALFFGPSQSEIKSKRAREIVNNAEMFDIYYGEIWRWVPKKYRTKEQIVRQDLGLEPKDVRLCVMGGAGYVCADAPNTWMPGDITTAIQVREDIAKEYGQEAAACWFQQWGWAQSLGAGWGVFSH